MDKDSILITHMMEDKRNIMIATDRLTLQRQIYNFLRTITVKYAPIADYINADLLNRGYSVNELDPTSWKYYQNLQGLYHVSDSLMYVTSVDTQERIVFNKENLVAHPRTRSVYVPGGAYYDRLCDTYPTQVDLIKSILFPVEDLTNALAAEDLTILAYGSGYLETYEENPLIEGLRNFLQIIKERWYFEFLDDEPYFYVTFYGTLWTKMAAFLMTERESYIRTPYVHSWHIWNQLRDRGIDDYSDILDREKSMMLYQNIDYFKANAGKMSNLIILANRLLDTFGISIYARRVIQEAETGAEQYQLTPQLQAVRIPINDLGAVTEISNETVETIQNRAYNKGFAVDNSSEAAVAKERALGDTTLNDFMTKFLEIRPIARNKVYADILNIFLLETLTTAVVNDYYNKPVLVNDPATNSVLYLYPRELLALYHYASLKSIGITATEIPSKFFFYRAFNTQIGTPVKTLPFEDEKIYVSMYVNAQGFLSDLHYNEDLEDPAAFTDMTTRLWLKFMEHHLEDVDTKIESKRWVLDYLASLCHTRRIEEHDLISGQSEYVNWLGPNGIDIQSTILSQYDNHTDPELVWSNLADAIITALIPMNDTLNFFGNYTLTDFGYERLRQLFIQMCSYKVVFLESTRSTPNFSLGGKWSSRYGPDSFDSYANRTILRNVHIKDSVVVNEKMILHRGFCEHLDTDVSQYQPHERGITVHAVSSQMTDSQALVKFVSRSKGNHDHSGTIHLCYGGMTPIGLEDEILDDYLVDEDGTRLIDLDGSYLIDPDT